MEGEDSEGLEQPGGGLRNKQAQLKPLYICNFVRWVLHLFWPGYWASPKGH